MRGLLGCCLALLFLVGCSGLKTSFSDKGSLYLEFGTRIEFGSETSETKATSSVEIEITKSDEEGN